MNAIAKLDLNNALAQKFFMPVDKTIIADLLERHTAKAKVLESAGHFFNCEASQELIRTYFMAEHKKNCKPLHEPKFNNLEKALSLLDAEFWDKALRETEIYELMPQARRTVWDKQIKSAKVPKFDRQTLTATLKDLLLSREKFLAERVEGIFYRLSQEHVTNQPQGFSKRMIMRVVCNYGHLTPELAGYVNDLRTVIAKFMGRVAPRLINTLNVLKILLDSPGEWREIDGGTLRVCAYKKGTCHFEVHPDIAWRLNEILSWLHPTAIPADLRRKPKKEKTYKPVEMTTNLAPFFVLDLLERLTGIPIESDDGKYKVNFCTFDIDKGTREKMEAFINMIGGVQESFGRVTFDYVPTDILNEIILTGETPDQKALQFYPTQEGIAKDLIEWADVKEWHKTLEPQAGQGHLAMLLPQENLTCVEVSSLFCNILEKKGMQNVINADFVEWASVAGNLYSDDDLYDRICMNPPFSMGRAEQHLTAASKLLKVGGILTAILPTGMKSKPELSGFIYEWSEEKKIEFSGASIPVVMLKMTRELYA